MAQELTRDPVLSNHSEPWDMLELLGKWHFLLELLNQEEVILELWLPGNGAIPVGK